MQNFNRILEATVRLLGSEPAPSVEQVAVAGGLGRGTVFRHFGGRKELLIVARQHMLDTAAIGLDAPADQDAPRDQDAPGLSRSGDDAAEPGLADLLARVPPHLIGEQIVAEARRLPGVSSAALYVVDIDGSRLLRFAGSEDFPLELHAPLAVGPESPLEGIANLRREVAEELSGVTASPLYLGGRAIGLLLAVDADQPALDQLAQHTAVAIRRAEPYTDALAIARRRKPISAAGEIQQNLLPPRVMQISGSALAGNALPSYDVSGDWFEYAENSDGAWLAVADGTGKGEAAASLAALALGAFRAARRSGANLEQAVDTIHNAIIAINENRAVSSPSTRTAVVTAVIARWHAPSATFTWITCGQSGPVLLTPNGAGLGAAGWWDAGSPSDRGHAGTDGQAIIRTFG